MFGELRKSEMMKEFRSELIKGIVNGQPTDTILLNLLLFPLNSSISRWAWVCSISFFAHSMIYVSFIKELKYAATVFNYMKNSMVST